MHSTPLSLLERLRHPADQDAWSRFVRLYTPLMCHWTRCVGMQDSDAADLMQDVFTLLVAKLPDFRHDGTNSFRSWLRTVTLNKRASARRAALPIARSAAHGYQRARSARRTLGRRISATRRGSGAEADASGVSARDVASVLGSCGEWRIRGGGRQEVGNDAGGRPRRQVPGAEPVAARVGRVA